MRVTDEWLEDYQRRQGGKKTPLTQALDTIAALPSQPKQSKYRNRKVEVNGITFDSASEARRWHELKQLEALGAISELQRQVVFILAPPVVIEGRKRPPLRFTADFTYTENGEIVVEDRKSDITVKETAFIMRRHLLKAVHGVDLKITK